MASTTTNGGRVRVGTASWSDPGFIREWYPPDLPTGQLLPWYAQHFNMVEVNSTFYAVPDRRVVVGWARKTPEDFVFNVKLPKLLSWHSMTADSLPTGIRKHARPKGHGVERSEKLVAAMIRILAESLVPLEESGKMGAALLQLSPAFSPRRNSLEELGELLDQLPWPTAVEFRNRGWIEKERLNGTLYFLTKHDAAYVNVDGPVGDNFMVMPSSVWMANLRDFSYVRCHGRNLEGYVRGRSVQERFNYDYPDRELEEIADRVEKLARATKQIYLVFNNNRGNYAPSAASRMQRILRRPTDARLYPTSTVTRRNSRKPTPR